MLQVLQGRSVVRNASDRSQVKNAERLELRRTRRLAAALKRVMQTAEGRLLMWSIVESAGIYRSVWSNVQAEVNRNVGRQDFGHELLADLIAVDDELYLQMEREMRALAKQENDEIDASHVASAEDKEQANG